MLRRDLEPWRLQGIENITRHECSITDAGRVASLVNTVCPDWIFHLAAYGAYSSQVDADRIAAVNTTGTMNLLDAVANAGGCRGLVHTGSSSEYGLKDHAPSEDEIVAPGSVYAITKCAATHAVSYWAQQHGLAGVTVRLYSVYGYWEEPTRLMPRLVAAALKRTLPPLTSPETARDFVWVDDAVDAIVRAAAGAADRPGSVWNVGSGIQTSLQQLIELARELFQIQIEPSWNVMPSRAWDTNCWVANPSLVRADLNWKASTDLRTGLLTMERWLSSPSVREIYEI